ncbi:(Fe-S)-binding protein [Geobacter argillaceus]|uniref:Glycolate oxidase iron-sulfur subunit n=1 Tax=Geobacter argillaceus TaxID=345631 RepID=A0A562VPF3_9BACT|nr:(Fe-S)-binding protein [Geobacter argillaceus]TWJ19896.1 glycolate oxidase iron-sulfur subunit [Geobacter argillaceus]
MDYVKLINCMRCGMCLPVCPTYKETFLETASPRGRVALVRKVQEDELDQSELLLEYLSLCLDCQACASACPCGVNAGELVAEFTCERKAKAGLGFMEDLILRKLVPHPDRLELSMAPMRIYQRSGLQKLVRTLGVLKMFPKPLERMEGLLPELPSRPLRQTIQEVTPACGTERGTVGFFLGCVMSLIFSEASRATIQLLSMLGYRVITPRAQVCCGAPNMLAGDPEGVKEAARTNVELFNGFEVDFIVTDCGGCGAELKKYGHHLDNAAAAEFSCKVRDISQVLALHADELQPQLKPLGMRVTYHDPCHIAHCQGLRREPRDLLKLIPDLSYAELNEADACCGSAGTYNIGQPEMSDRVLRRKVENIRATDAELLVTSNPGCLLQLRKALADVTPQIRVVHLTELLLASSAGTAP